MPEKRKEQHVGTVEHYYPKAQAATVHLDADLRVGDKIHVKGHSDDVTARVETLEKDHERIQEAHAGESVGVGLRTKVHERSEVTRVVDASEARPRTQKRPPRPAGPAAPRRAPGARKAVRKTPAAKAPKRKAPAKTPKRKAAAKAAKRKAPPRKSPQSPRKSTKRAR